MPATPGAWAVSTDLLLENRHFLPDVAPETLGHKALAVNLSDLAAMGASPRGFVLGLGLPAVRPQWVAAFSQGLLALADRHRCPLVGGDTTRSDSGIVISVTIFGALDARRALRRDAARPQDDIWVSGALGEADVALRLLLRQRAGPGDATAPPPGRATEAPQEAGSLPDDDALNHALSMLDEASREALLAATRHRLELPEPRIALGQALAGVAHAAIDISDGLLQDLGHVLTASGCAAHIDAPALPVGALDQWLAPAMAWRAALGGGDAYELCFTAAPSRRSDILNISQRLGLPLTRIGCIRAGQGAVVADAQGVALRGLPGGFDHFDG